MLHENYATVKDAFGYSFHSTEAAARAGSQSVIHARLLLDVKRALVRQVHL